MEERQRADDAQSSSPPLTHGITYNPNVLSDMYSNNMSSTPNTDAHSTEPSSSPRYSVRQHDRLTTGHPQLRRRQPVSHATMLMPDVQAKPPFPFTPTADHQDGQGIADSNQSPPNLRMPSPPYQSNTNDTNASGPSNLQFENSVPYSDTSALRIATEYREYGGYHHLYVNHPNQSSANFFDLVRYPCYSFTAVNSALLVFVDSTRRNSDIVDRPQTMKLETD